MTHHAPPLGHTLPELLVGLSLGLLVVAAATVAWGVSRQGWLSMSAAEAVHANARTALRVLHHHALLAGTLDAQASSPNAWQLISPYNASTPDLAGVGGSKTVRSLTLGHSQAVDAHDCQGNHSSTQAVIRNDFKLNTNRELSCKDLNTAGSTYQALAEGVEDFQVRYAQANPSAQTLQWRSAEQVSDMAQVMAIEVCLRIASLVNVQAPPPSTPLTGCAGETVAHDGQLRRVFRRVIALPNRRGVMP